MKRRDFLRNTSLISLPVFFSGIPVSSYSRSQFTQLLEGDDDRVLVLIQLNGGNDGLSTVIPIDQYDRLSELRSNILVPESSIVKITDDNGLHPSFAGMKTLFDDQRMSIIQGVAYPNQNRSHFRSTDIWHTASDANEFLDSGWLGRSFYEDFPSYPDNFPNEQNPDPIAITMGLQVSETCQGPVANYSIALNGEDSLTPINETEGDVSDDTCYGREVAFIRETIKQLNAYSEVVANAFEMGANSVAYPDNNGLAQQLKLVAKLISGGLRTKVYVVSIGGFDTHANQVDQADTRTGNHATLLERLSEAISLFQNDLDMLGVGDRVVGMTYSEFGRRIRSNGSFGTDHGTGAPLILFGNCVNGGLIGRNPDLSGEIDQNEGVPMQFDFRSIYASILMDWFGVEESKLRTFLYEDFQYIPLATGCQSTSTDDISFDDISINVFPNPARNRINLEVDQLSGTSRIAIFNMIGYKLNEQVFLSHGRLSASYALHNYPSGSYFLRIENGPRVWTKKFIKY